MELNKLRRQIDEIDVQLISLLNQRAALAEQIGKLKKSLGKNVIDIEREKFIFERLKLLNQGPLSQNSLEEIFKTIISRCREIQK